MKKPREENESTRWNAASGKTEGEWLEFDLGEKVQCNNVHFRQFLRRITTCKILCFSDVEWHEAFAGGTDAQDDFNAVFPPVEGSKVRLVATGTSPRDPESGTPSISEIEVYNLKGEMKRASDSQ